MAEPFGTILTLLKTFQKPILDGLNGISDEAKQKFDNGLSAYLDSIETKFSYAKTFLHRNQKVEFYRAYFPTRLEPRDRKVVKTNSINSFFKESHCVSITGIAGSGKSMLMKHLFLNAIKENFRIPIFLELRKLNEIEGTLFDHLSQYLLDFDLASNKKILERMLKEGSFVFLFDGYDEIKPDKKQKVTDEIEVFMDRYNLNYFAMTSRPGTFMDGFPRFENYHVAELSSEEIQSFIFQQIKIEGSETEIAERMIDTIKSPENRAYRAYVANPLLLSMYFLKYKSDPELPKKKSKFYADVFYTLCTRHDAQSKSGWRRPKKSGLGNDELEDILKIFCLVSYFDGTYEFSDQYLKEKLKIVSRKLDIDFITDEVIHDLRVCLSILIKDGHDYRFPHRSMQEYFASQFISKASEIRKEKLYFRMRKDLLFEKESMVKSADTPLGSIYQNPYFHVNQAFNFWGLLRENDSKYFLKYFLIPLLESEISNIQDEKKILEYLWNTLRFSEIRYYFEEDIDHFYIPWNRIGMNKNLPHKSDLTIVGPIFEYFLNRSLTRPIFDAVIPSKTISSPQNDFCKRLKNEVVMNRFDTDHGRDGIYYFDLSLEEIKTNQKFFHLVDTSIIEKAMIAVYRDIIDTITHLKQEVKALDSKEASIVDLIDGDQ